MTRHTTLALVTLFVALYAATVTTLSPAAAAPVNSAPEVNVNRVCYFTDRDDYMCSLFRMDSTWLRTEAMDKGAWIVTGQAAPQTPGVTGCNDEMVCPWMYSPIQVTRQCIPAAVGFPTCYSLQDDGTWAREELADTNANWVMVGSVTFDEVGAAVGNIEATRSTFVTGLPTSYTEQKASTEMICPTEPTDRPICYTLLPDGTKVLAAVPPGSTGP